MRIVTAVLLVLAALVVAYSPWVLFWAIRTLFGYRIDVTWSTWAAAWVLVCAFGRGGGGSGGKS